MHEACGVLCAPHFDQIVTYIAYMLVQYQGVDDLFTVRAGSRGGLARRAGAKPNTQQPVLPCNNACPAVQLHID